MDVISVNFQSVGLLTPPSGNLRNIHEFSSQSDLHLNTPIYFDCTFTLSRSVLHNEHPVIDATSVLRVESIKY